MLSLLLSHKFYKRCKLHNFSLHLTFLTNPFRAAGRKQAVYLTDRELGGWAAGGVGNGGSGWQRPYIRETVHSALNL